MTALDYNPFVDPQSPATPISTNFLRDEFDAVDVVEKDATGEQRVIAIGSSIPIVFCKFDNNSGGTWVSPAAARYGLQLSDTLNNSFALGLIISEGSIGDIDVADIYKGGFQLSSLSDIAVVNSFGSMPTENFDYSFSNTITTPGDPGTPDTETVEVIEDSAIKTDTGFSWSKSFWNTAFTFNNTSSLSFGITVFDDLIFDPVPLDFHYRVRVNNVTVVEEIPDPAKNSYSFSHTNSGVNATYTVQVRYPSYLAGSATPGFVDVRLSPFLSTRHQVTTIPGEPATLPTYTTVGLPLSPGSGGSFEGMSCLAVKGSYTQDASVGDYREQIRCFVRNGIEVENISTGAIESSDNFMDLAYYLLKSNKVSDDLIDMQAFQDARNFLATNKLYFNGVIANSVNLREFFSAVAPGLMLRFVQEAGKFSFKPVLPTTLAGNIDTGSVSPVKTFTVANILPKSFIKRYYESQLRKPICVLLSWREQFKQAYSVAVTTEIRYANTALEGPFESYDFSDFITDINHTTLVGKYILSSRARVTHSISFQTSYDIAAGSEKLAAQLQPLDIIRVDLQSSTTLGGVSVQSLYQVSSISESLEGNVQIEAVHFPVDEGGASLIAADIFGEAYSVS